MRISDWSSDVCSSVLPVFSLLGKVYPKLDWAPRPLRAKSTLQALARDSVAGYFHSVSILDDRLRRRLYSARMHRDLQGYHARDVLEDTLRDAPVDNHQDRVQTARPQDRRVGKKCV